MPRHAGLAGTRRVTPTTRHRLNTPTASLRSVFPEFSFRMFHPSLLCLTVILISQSALARPRPENIRETAQTKSDKSTAEREENAELVGGGIDLLISEIFHRIIQERLENLLEGVSQPIKQELLDSSEYKIERNSAFEEQDLSVEVSLPVSVTEIPTDIFTSLPGSDFTF